jgi:serine/threonine protein kinase
MAIPKQKQKQIALLNQGSYGCIIRPSITCAGKIGSPQYITKIQNRKDVSEREVNISNIIRTIPFYSKFFAPIIDSCEVNIGVIQGDEIQQCDFIHENKENKDNKDGKYFINKIKYIGKYNIAEYLLHVFHNEPYKFINELLRTYKNILQGIIKMNQKGVIHMDLKHNNIMIQENDKRPIIIDFGLSVTEDLIQNKKREAFFAYGPEYGPWCFDLCLITYGIIKAQDKTASMNILLEILNQFFMQNPRINELLTKEEYDDYKKLLMTYITKFENKPWADIINELSMNKNSWDNYSISVVYLSILQNIDTTSFTKDFDIVLKFQELLKSIMLSNPDQRNDAVATNDMLEKTFTNMSSRGNPRTPSEPPYNPLL